MASSSASSDSGDETHSGTVDKASDHTQYRLRVTAGTSYLPSTHRLVHVNAAETLTFDTPEMTLSIVVRLQNFTGLPEGSPTSAPYFEDRAHRSDQYSIAFSFVPKVDIPGADLVFGNDFDRPIRDRLPPGFNWALGFVKSWIDPGLDGDVYSDTPYLYGPALSSWNVFRIGERVSESQPTTSQDADGEAETETGKTIDFSNFHSTILEEGADGSGAKIRSAASIPADAGSRKKFFLKEDPSTKQRQHLNDFVFEAGRLYQSDFGNQYLNFNDFSLKLPGFSINVIGYIDSKTHELRYALKNKSNGTVYAVVLFTLLFGGELEETEKKEEEKEVKEVDEGLQKTKLASEPATAAAEGGDDDELD